MTTLKSWIPYDVTSTDFPIQNLPIGIFSTTGRTSPRAGIAIGNFVLDLYALHLHGLLSSLPFDSAIFGYSTLNEYMSLNRSAWRATRQRVTDLLVDEGGDSILRENPELQKAVLVALSEVTMHLPANIGDYTDFYSSREHATNIGIMLRGKDNALQPNWLHLPVGYHGRASSVVISGTDIVRPTAQVQKNRENPAEGPLVTPCRLFDFELEMAFFVGGPENPLGQPLTIAEAEDRIFGLVLMNDWSARDIQAWEYVPLGPFTSKNVGTSISPWIVSLDALEPFRCQTSEGPVQNNPEPQPYLFDPNYSQSTYDIKLEVAIAPANSNNASVVCQSNLRHMYWNMKQQLVHHAVTGCNLRAGDLLGSGTISGTSESSFGSMMELSWRGSKEVVLSNSIGEDGKPLVRKFLQDGDNVIISGHADSPNGYKIGFGIVSGKVLPAGTKVERKEEKSCTSCQCDASGKSVCSGYTDFKLYSYWRSSSSWRVRTALAIKGIKYEYIPVDLLQLVGNNTNTLPAEYQSVNPLAQVPTFEAKAPDGSIVRLTQSMAIIQFIEDICPLGKSLYPRDPLLKAKALQMAEIVASSIQPLQNLSVLRQVKQVELTGTNEVVDSRAFAKHSIEQGLTVLEGLVASCSLNGSSVGKRKRATFAVGGSEPSVADLAIIPQLYNAARFGVDLSKYPVLSELYEFANEHGAFKASKPEVQPDAKL